jgi:hypothetical protein
MVCGTDGKSDKQPDKNGRGESGNTGQHTKYICSRFSVSRHDLRNREFSIMDYGTDLFWVDDDMVFTPDGDVALVSGP